MREYEIIAELVKNAASVVILTGAGASKASGIPTFRDALDGYWSDFDPEELASPRGFRKNPKLVLEWYEWRRNLVRKCSPNAAHVALTKWEGLKDFTLVTQNVDGLHQLAGSTRVLEMHGSLSRVRCVGNAHKFPASITEGETDPEQPKSRCPQCSSVLRPDIVWFDELIPGGVLKDIKTAIKRCDLFLAIGTSGMVYPAAGFLDDAGSNGAKTIAINPDAFSRGSADIFLKGDAEVVLPEITKLIFGVTE